MTTAVTIDGLGTLELLRSKRAWKLWTREYISIAYPSEPSEYPCLAFVYQDSYEDPQAGYIYHADAAAMLRVLETGK